MIRKNKLLVWMALFIGFVAPLWAKPNAGRFHLNKGDWFEIKASMPLNIRTQPDSLSAIFNVTDPSNLWIWLRYQLIDQTENGNQIYQVSIPRIQARSSISYGGVWLGYDSYYPSFNPQSTSSNFYRFEMEVKPNGELQRFDSISGQAPKFVMEEISPKKSKLGFSYTLSLPANLFEGYSALFTFLPDKTGEKPILLPDSNPEISFETTAYHSSTHLETYRLKRETDTFFNFSFLKEQGVPAQSERWQLVDASFAIAPNTLIRGKIPALAHKQITLSLEGYNNEAYFTPRTFTVESDGSFSCPLFLNAPYYLKLSAGNKSQHLFLEPNDTLEIRKLDELCYIDQTVFFERPFATGHRVESDQFGGKAAYNARLSAEMEEWMPYPPMPKSVEDYKRFCKTIEENIATLFTIYKGKASQSCVDYFKSKWIYFLVSDKLYYADASTMVFGGADMDLNKAKYAFPDDFFDELDTISTLMYPYKWSTQYKSYLEYTREFSQKQMSRSVGGIEDDFYGNYFAARASLKGYPLYLALYKTLDAELRKGTQSALRVETFYQEFMQHCNDPMFTAPLQETHNKVGQIAIGGTFPVTQLTLKDSTTFDLTRFKGKPLCMITLNAPNEYINLTYKKKAKVFRESEAEFLFVLLPNTYIQDEPLDSTLFALPNVTLIESLNNDFGNQILFKKPHKTFVLDKWFRIVEDDIKTPYSSEGTVELEQAIQNAIQAKRMTEQEKASIFKTAGWSLGSILVTLILGLVIYKVRVRRIRRQEAFQRQIKELEIKAIRSQMNPHFIFNALNSIQSLVSEKQYREAHIYLSKFSVLLRGVLHHSERNMVPLEDELKSLQRYCELEQLRFEFAYTLEVDSEIDTELIEIPGMVIQPLAENAIVHGLASLREKGKLSVKVWMQGEYLTVEVTDNGPGLSPKAENKLNSNGYGLKLVRERLNLFNHHKNQAELLVENLPSNTGTRATLKIPID